MTRIDLNTTATNLDNATVNEQLLGEGYTIRHIETWHTNGSSESFIVWDNPELTDADIPY